MIEEVVLQYWSDAPWEKKEKITKELECRFGYVNPISRIEFENVIKKLKSLGFSSSEQDEMIFLRLVPSKTNTWGTKEELIPMSSRIKLNGCNLVEEYINNNPPLKSLMETHNDSISFQEKKLSKNSKNESYKPILFPDFNFKISYTEELDVHPETVLENFEKSTMNYYRLVHRIGFSRKDLPFLIDFSVVEGTQGLKFKKEDVVTKYEIEIELKNDEIGVHDASKCKTNTQLAFLFRKVIKYILCGLQQTNFPVGLLEQQQVLQEYKDVVSSEKFIGPNSRTIQLENWMDESMRKGDYAVTEKADGERHLMFISSSGKLYLINQMLSVIFTGCISKKEAYCFTILDGELILHDCEGRFINMFAVFDIYFLGEQEMKTKKARNKTGVQDCRGFPFLERETKEKKKQQNRYKLLESFFKKFIPMSIIEEDTTIPMNISLKKFLFPTKTKTIFKCNKSLLETVFPYKTDGLIFTSCTDKVDDNCSLKWKTIEQNTIDFLVEESKEEDEEASSKITEFKTGKLLKKYILKCGYTKSQLQLDPKSFVLKFYTTGSGYSDLTSTESSSYMNRQFVPTNPYTPNAGICLLPTNGEGECFTEETRELILNKSIVEFRYDLETKNWIPIRLRNDKKEFGNNFNTANSNWKFMHCPVTKDMLMQDKPLDPLVNDMYYNPVLKSTLKTTNMKLFHNFIKRKLLAFALNKGKTLIDLACGKAGDLHKWIHNKLDFVLGIDLFQDNIVNVKDGCYARFLEQCFFYNRETKQLEKKVGKQLSCLFVQGDCGKDIKSGEGITLSEDYAFIEKLFDSEEEEQEEKEDHKKKRTKPFFKVPKGLFDVCSCQFALHYFFKNRETLKKFLVNVYNTTKVGGYFVGCCFDGKKVFDIQDEVTEINDSDGNRIFLLQKGYKEKPFAADSDSLGMKISVYQESINSLVDEYLVNFEYLDSVMELFGFFPVQNEELFHGHVLFEEIFRDEEAYVMTEEEKRISFLNRLFIYQKKTAILNPERIVV
jgi:mRNA capping enzyme/mRNA capping enzyme, catalytic domain/mRNA capping enzyme, C-terminal domain